MMGQFTNQMSEIMICPETGQALELVSRERAEAVLGRPLKLLRDRREPPDSLVQTLGAVTHVLLRADHRAAYAIVDEIPILLVPEAIGRPDEYRELDLTDPRYAESYEEMAHYNQVAADWVHEITRSNAYAVVDQVQRALPSERQSFPEPRSVWLDATYDSASQWDAYRHISPVRDKCVMQLGGTGIHAVKFLLAGAAEAWLATPMLAEAQFSRALAAQFGVSELLRCVVAIAEELPLKGEAFDLVYSGGCVHHMVTEIALPEIARVLKSGGRFAAIDPWRAPFYGLGTKAFGKREPNVFCRPLTRTRVAPLRDAFNWSKTVHHGAISRYMLLALSRLGLRSSLETVWQVNRIDDGLSSFIPGMRQMGSSVALLGIK
jgi:uncharacterized protein YbaR (Trm112 family)